jgi:putative ABC transport system ATP-binding protein
LRILNANGLETVAEFRLGDGRSRINGVAQVDPVVIGFADWRLPSGSMTPVFVVGSDLKTGVDLTLAGGELTVLMGPSGSGKTTLLSIIGCMLAPTEGTVRIRGISIERAGPEELAKIRRLHIGFVFQSFHLFPTLTAAENVHLALDVRGERRSSSAKAKSLAVLEKVGLLHKTAAFPRDLSGGEQQRIAIARAIVAEPSVILADEPTPALDGANGRAIMTILSTIAKEQNRAVLVVTHDTRLLGFAERIIHIEDGSLTREERSKSEIYRMRA